MMKIIIVHLFIVAIFASPTNEDSEAALNLIGSLKQDSTNELTRVNSVWQKFFTFKQAHINSLEDARKEQAGNCNTQQNDIQMKILALENAKDYIKWMSERVDSNNKRIQVLSQQNCDGNINYINGLKNNKILLSIIQYLRNALKNYQDSSLVEVVEQDKTLSQIHQMVKIFNDYRTGKVGSEFLQEQAKNREIELTSEMAVGQLIELLNQMETEIKNDIGNSQDNQVQSGVGFADFKSRIFQENEAFEKMTKQQQELIENFERQLKILQNRLKDCNQRLFEIKVAIDVAQEGFAQAKDDFKKEQDKLTDEIALFDELYRIYSTQIKQKEISLVDANNKIQ